MTLRFGSIHHPDHPLTTGRLSMPNPAKNRLHDYEAGWLTLLVEMGVATKEQANEAMCRVAQAAIDEMNEQRERRRARRGRKEP